MRTSGDDEAMPMKAIATINLVDRDTGDDASVIVRADAETVGLALSLRANGDIEVFMSRTDARHVAEALREALAAE